MPEPLPSDAPRSSSRDHSTLRARLVGRELENRAVEAELRNAILEREARDEKGPSPTEADGSPISARRRKALPWLRGGR
jgi:hypothetical protein